MVKKRQADLDVGFLSGKSKSAPSLASANKVITTYIDMYICWDWYTMCLANTMSRIYVTLVFECSAYRQMHIPGPVDACLKIDLWIYK